MHSRKKTFSSEDVCERNLRKIHLKKPRATLTVSKYENNKDLKNLMEFPATRMLFSTENSHLVEY